MSSDVSALSRRLPFRRTSPPPGDVTPRDLAIVARVARYRFLTSDQIARADGGSHQQVLRRLRSLPSDSWVPVAMVTAFSAETDRRRALDAGAAAYWLKPVDFSHLERELSTLLSRDAERRP